MPFLDFNPLNEMVILNTMPGSTSFSFLGLIPRLCSLNSRPIYIGEVSLNIQSEEHTPKPKLVGSLANKSSFLFLTNSQPAS